MHDKKLKVEDKKVSSLFLKGNRRAYRNKK